LYKITSSKTFGQAIRVVTAEANSI